MGRPYGLSLHGNNDTVGAAAAVAKRATGSGLGLPSTPRRASAPTNWGHAGGT
ncbi:hypothetical protein I545_1196 [Mycobacterium kansasii 662]|uniref:Uncharacterized protein n=1 Tax=Mycobacterium kansasii 662 TaxID=1299326 RepID=X7ZSD8_MYCKA|nr:hypothetical protein I545_1196 [Mycobacterium kansasii 662]